MQYLRSAVLTFIILTVVLFFASCGGGGSSTSVGPITSITLSPSPTISLNGGDTFQMSVTATDARGRAVNNQTLTFNSSASTVAEIASGGNLAGLICAGGQWFDGQSPPHRSLTSPVVCTPPPVPPPAVPTFNSGTTTITVTAQGVTSNAVTVNVHPKVARVVLTASTGSCVSQGGQVVYTAAAFDTAGNDITASVGSFNWSIADSTVGTLASSSTTVTSNTVTAVIPGVTTVTASVNNTNPVNSAAVVFQECPVASIVISSTNTNPNLAFNPSPGALGATGQLSAVVKDINGAVVNNVTLTWNSSVPAAATVNSSGLVAGVAYGTSSITASCALNGTCNKGQGSLVTSNTVTASVGPGASGTTIYATGTGTTSFVPIDSGTNTAGTAITLPYSPNSMILDPQGANAYLGSGSGLMVVNTTNNTYNKTITNAAGKVLAVSPSGQLVLIGGSGFSTVIYNNSANTVTTLSAITNAVAADFSPDSTESVVADTTGVRVVQGTVVRTVSSAVTPTDVSFLATGALAYLAAANTPSVVACNSTLHAGGASGTTTLVKTLPDGSKVLGAQLPNLVVVAVATSGTTCPPTIAETPSVLAFTGGTTAKQIIITSNGTHAYVTSDLAGKLLSYDVVGNVTGAVNLVGTAPVTTTGGVTLDSASVYVGVNDGGPGSVHKIDVASGTDTTQISVSFVPDLVAVRAH